MKIKEVHAVDSIKEISMVDRYQRAMVIHVRLSYSLKMDKRKSGSSSMVTPSPTNYKNNMPSNNHYIKNRINIIAQANGVDYVTVVIFWKNLK